ncbi:MAG: hypothetical protein R3185_08625, partial [Candidatus Thermoplasmatota archaeon]|nr:hypothetical protein [Candidatus Thermoplasmatota archaeon]
MRWLLPALILLFLLPAPGAFAHGGQQLVITHDTLPDGTTYVGAVNTLGFVLYNDQGQPDFHNNAEITLTLNDRILYATTEDAGHDYDGVDALTVTFPEPGPYTYTVHVPGKDLTATFQGEVLPRPTSTLNVETTLPEQAVAGELVSLTFDVEIPGEGPGVHSSGWLEITDQANERRVLLLPTHGHEGTHTVDYAFPAEGTYTVAFTAHNPYPGEKAPPVQPATVTRTVTVAEAPAPMTPVEPPSRQPLENAVTTIEDQRLQLHGTYDPYTSVGTMGRIHL